MQTALRLLCLVLDTSKWEDKIGQLYEDKEFLQTASKKLITSTSPSL